MNRSLFIAIFALNLAACGAEPLAPDLDVPVTTRSALRAVGGDGTSLPDPRIDPPPAPPPRPPRACAPLSGPVTIGFDDVPSGTIIDQAYNHQGVTLSPATCAGCSGPHVYADHDTLTGNNDVSLFAPPAAPMFDARWGAVKAAFTTCPLPRSVSISAMPTRSPEGLEPVIARPFLEAFDATGALIAAEALYPLAYGSQGWGSWQTLTVTSRSNNIGYVLFSSQAPGTTTTPVYGSFDNLAFAP